MDVDLEGESAASLLRAFSEFEEASISNGIQGARTLLSNAFWYNEGGREWQKSGGGGIS